MAELDLNNFKDKSTTEVETQLLSMDFKLVIQSSQSSYYALEGHDILVKVSKDPVAASLFSNLCQDQVANPYLPTVFEQLKTNKEAHLCVMERLYSAEELGSTTLEGIRRAFATFIEGDQMHVQVHKEMEHDFDLVKAMDVISKELEGSHLHISTNHENVQFRKVEESYHPVFTDPYQSSKAQLETVRDRHSRLLEGLSSTESQETCLPNQRGRPPSFNNP